MNEQGQTKALDVASPTRALSVDAQENIDNLRAIQYAAKMFMKSGCFADIKGPSGNAIDEEVAIAKAVVKIAIGRDYGFSCAESMQYIELIQGRPSIAAHARAAKMKAAGYSWRFVKFDATICNLVVSDPKGVELGDSVFTMEDAKRMNLAAKDNWVKNPRNMLYCRAISNAQRWYAPEVLSASLATKEDVLDGDYTVIEEHPQILPKADDPPAKSGTAALKDKLKAQAAGQPSEPAKAANPSPQSAPPSEGSDTKAEAPGPQPVKQDAPPAPQPETAKDAEPELFTDHKESEPARGKRPEPAGAAVQPVEYESWDAWERAGARLHPLVRIAGGEQAGMFQDVDGNYRPVPEAPKAGPQAVPPAEGAKRTRGRNPNAFDGGTK